MSHNPPQNNLGGKGTVRTQRVGGYGEGRASAGPNTKHP
jgi:hypothetical protein